MVIVTGGHVFTRPEGSDQWTKSDIKQTGYTIEAPKRS